MIPLMKMGDVKCWAYWNLPYTPQLIHTTNVYKPKILRDLHIGYVTSSFLNSPVDFSFLACDCWAKTRLNDAANPMVMMAIPPDAMNNEIAGIYDAFLYWK